MVFYATGRWKMKVIVMMLSLLLTGLASVGSLRAQIKKADVDFEYIEAYTMKSGDTLAKLAAKYYSDPNKWQIIKEKNKIPNETRIRVGTVIYVPSLEPKKVVVKPPEEEKVEKEIIERKVVVDEMAAKLAESQKELERFKAEYNTCLAQNKELTESLSQKDAKIADLEAKIKNFVDTVKAQSELEDQLKEMRTAARATAERREELGKQAAELQSSIKVKEERIVELEAKLKQSQGDLSKLEAENKDLKAKAEKEKKPVAPKRVSDPRARVAAIAIALVGSIIWMASGK